MTTQTTQTITMNTAIPFIHVNCGKLAWVITLMVCFSAVMPQPSVYAAGNTAFPILMELTDARALALGGAIVSDRGWSEGAFINPASAVGSKRAASVNYADHMLDLWSSRVNINYPLQNDIIIGGYITTFNYGEFDRTIGGNETGEVFNASENVIGVYAAGEFNSQLSWGGGLKIITGSLDNTNASGQAIDIGITYDPQWEDLQLGLAARNLGVQSDGYGNTTYPLPRELIIGGSRRLKGLPLTMRLNAGLTRADEGTWQLDDLPGNVGINLGAGGEFEIKGDNWDRPMQLRFGYRSISDGLRVGNDEDMLAGLSVGIGIPLPNINFDYAFASFGSLGEVHRFGFSSRF